jgi:hypothetical protein
MSTCCVNVYSIQFIYCLKSISFNDPPQFYALKLWTSSENISHITHSLMELSSSWEAANCTATQELPSVLWNPKVHYRSHKCLHWSLSWARSIQSPPSHPISLRSILILSTHLRLGLPNGLLPSGFPTNILYAFLLSPIRATCPAHVILLTWSV